MEAMAAFREAASRRGAYEAALDAGAAALDAALAFEEPLPHLLKLQPEFARLLTNISCRLSKRSRALRPQRDALAALNSRLNRHLKALGVRGDQSKATHFDTCPSNCTAMGRQGPRHLCEHGCYLHAYDEARRARAAELPPTSTVGAVGAGTASVLDRRVPMAASPTIGRKRRRSGEGLEESPVRMVTSRFFAPSMPAAAQGSVSMPPSPPALPAVAAAPPWRPPHSPFGLLEELLWDRPWALLLCCILLNQTTRAQVDGVLARLLASFPDAASLAAADVAVIEQMLHPLGLHRRRARTLITFSAEFLKGAWRRPEELPGIGRYAADAHTIFCEGRWAEVQPHDHALQWYCDWLRLLTMGEAGGPGLALGSVGVAVGSSPVPLVPSADRRIGRGVL